MDENEDNAMLTLLNTLRMSTPFLLVWIDYTLEKEGVAPNLIWNQFEILKNIS
jgi:hypothetical protein